MVVAEEAGVEERLLQVAQVSSGTGAESQACSYICNSWETVRIGLAAAAATQTPANREGELTVFLECCQYNCP